MAGFLFNVENEVKQEFLSKKPSQTAESDAFVLRSADQYESLTGKSIYNLSYEELREMIAMQFKNSSPKVVTKNVSVLKKYIDFCIGKNLVEHGENRLDVFVASNALKFVNRQALLNKYISPEKLKEYQNILYNEQDKLLLQLPYVGVWGKGLEEIINLTLNDIDEKNKMITLSTNDGKHRRLEVDLYTIGLIEDVYKQETYVENNGEITTNIRRSEPRKLKVNQVEKYIFRVPGQHKYEVFTKNLLNSRMKRIQKWVDNPYLSFISLRDSGMLTIASKICTEKDIVTKEDYIRISEKFNYGAGQPDRYWYVIKTMFEQYKEVVGI